jgi:hypothetical protein
LADLDCHNNSTTNVCSDPPELDDSEDSDLLHEDDSDAQNHKEAIDSLGESSSTADMFCNDDDNSQEYTGQVEYFIF